MAQRKLIERLDRLKRQARAVMVSHGLVSVTITVLATFFAMVAVDWLVSLPASLRITLLFAATTFTLILAYKRIVRPAIANVSLEEVAAKVEARFPELSDRLVSTVNFLEAPAADAGDTSRAMREKVIERTQEAIDRLPISAALSFKSLTHMIALALVCTSVWGALAWAAPHWPRIGMQRYLDPFGSAKWPRRVQIQPITRNQKVALGDALPLVMQVIRGNTTSLRPTVHLRPNTGPRRVFDMQAELDGTYRWMTAPLTQDFDYWYEAGDDSTADRPFHVKVVKRPAVTTGIARLSPPPYAVGFPSTDIDLDQRQISAVVGSHIEIIIESSKPLAADSSGAQLIFETGTSLTLINPVADHPLTFAADFVVQRDDAFRIQLTDPDGFSNRNDGWHRITARADQIPTVTVIEPKAQLEVTPDATVDILAQIQDDFGLVSAGLTSQSGADKDSIYNDLTKALHAERKTDRIDATLAHSWDLVPFKLQPGDVVVYRLEAIDNFPNPAANHAANAGANHGANHGAGVSSDLRLKVVSHEKFAERVRDEFQLLRGRVRRLLTEQENIKDETDSIPPDRNDQKPLTEGQQEAVARLAGQQSRLAARTEQISQRFAQVIDRMEQNRLRDEDAKRQAQENGDSLTQTAGGPMRRAGDQLNQAQQTDPKQGRQKLKEAGEEQEEAIEALEQILQRMERWSNFSDVVRKTRSLLDRQEEVTRDTGEVGKATMGKEADELSSKEKTALSESARRQERLAEEADRLVSRMKDMSQATKERDPASSEALKSAGQSAASKKVVQKMQQAAERIADNKAAQASGDQHEAERHLRKMLEKLEQRQRRQLEELAKRLEKIEETLRHFIAVQHKLLADNRSAQAAGEPADVFKALSDGQSALKRNAQLLAEEIGKVDELARVSRQVRKASLQMATAAIQLADVDGAKAEEAQTQALDDLKLALDRIEKIQSQTQKEMVRQDLAAISGEIKKVRQEQGTVLKVTEEVARRFEKTRRMMRIDAQRLSQLSAKEAAIREKLSQMRTEIASAEVYNWVLDRVIGDAKRVKTLFDERDVKGESVKLQKRMISRLDRLIDALALDEDEIQEEKFAGETGSGGGQGKPGQSGIPAMAELKVLKAMQLDINDRTAAVAEQVESAEPTEGQLEDIREIGDDQEQVRELAEHVIERATGKRK